MAGSLNSFLSSFQHKHPSQALNDVWRQGESQPLWGGRGNIDSIPGAFKVSS